MHVSYTPTFIRAYKNLSVELQQEVKERIELFKKNPHHPYLKTHKLKGTLKGRWSFSINFEYRIVFIYLSSNEAAFLTCGDHTIYS